MNLIMRMVSYLVTTVSALLLMGCVEVIDLDSLRPEPSLVVNGVALAGEPFTVSVSRTWFLTEELSNVIISKADVRLFVNDAFVSKMEYMADLGEAYNSGGAFHSSYYPQVGDRVRVEVSEPEYGEAWVEAVVPSPGNLLSATASTAVVPGPGWYKTQKNTYTVTFRDEASTKDYYLFRLDTGEPIYDSEKEQYTGEYEWSYSYVNYAVDPIFGHSISSLDQILGNDWLSGVRGRVFSDELVNGQEYTINLVSEIREYGNSLVPDDSVEAPNSRLRVYLYTISKDYYFYLQTLQDQSDDNLSNMLVDIGLAEPVQVYSNVEGGVGIVGACCRDMLEIEIKK